MSPLKDRPAADVIVIILTLVVAFVIVFATVGLAIGLFTGGDPNIPQIAKAIGDLTGSLIALIVGYVAGRGAKTNGNGH